MNSKVSCETMDSSVGSELVSIVDQDAVELALLRAWDSQREPELIAAALARLGIPSRSISVGALVDLRKVSLVTLAAALFGFDELWLGSEATEWSALDLTPPLTSDCVDLSRDECAPFRSALLKAGAKLALADGCGLNIVRVGADD